MIASAAPGFGLVSGDLSNFVIRRASRWRSFAWLASTCPSYGEPIAPRGITPLASYLLRRGRHRGCGAPIPVCYPLIEALAAILFGITSYKSGADIRLISALLLITALVSLAGIDLERRLVPGAGGGFVLSVDRDPVGWWIDLVSEPATFGGLSILDYVYLAGMGYVQVGGRPGALFGPYGAPAAFLGASVVGGPLPAPGSRRRALPFGVFMAFLGLVALFGRSEILAQNLGLVGV